YSSNQTGVNSHSDFSDNDSDWQTVPPASKRLRSPNSISPTAKKPDNNIFISANRFSPIAPLNEPQPMETTLTNPNINANKTSKPPPIFIQEQINYNNFCQKIKQLTDESGFDCKSSSSLTSRIITSHFTHSNQKRKKHIVSIYHSKHNTFETPHPKKEIPQCHRCQNYGHTRSYCNHSPRCVRCGRSFPSAELGFLSQTLSFTHIIGTDFNAKYLTWSHYTNTRSRALQNFILLNHLKITASLFLTYWPSHSNCHPDNHDFLITYLPNHFSTEIININNSASDHTPVLLLIGAQPSLKKNRPTISPSITNWNKFKITISNKIILNTKLKTSSDVNQAITKFSDDINKSAMNSSTQSLPYSQSPNLSPKLRQLIAEKRRRTQRTHYPMDKTPLLLYANPDNTLATTDREKADILAQELLGVFKPHLISILESHMSTVMESLQSTLPMSLSARPTSPAEIESITKKLANNKSPGHDLISNKAVENLPTKAIIHLTHIYNAALRLLYFPTTWKSCVIVIFLKPGKPPENSSSYRLISLLPVLGKIIEKIILKRITTLAQANNSIPNFQSGFRSHLVTTHQLHWVADIISKALETKQYCAGVFLDIAKAFDTVWHEGSDIAPFLYNIYTYDLPTSENTIVGTYADDIALLSASSDCTIVSQQLQTHLNTLSEWFTNWKIKNNESKSSFVTFSLRPHNCPAVSINNTIIPHSNEVEYLGLTFDRRLTWSPHLKDKPNEQRLRRLDGDKSPTRWRCFGTDLCLRLSGPRRTIVPSTSDERRTAAKSRIADTNRPQADDTARTRDETKCSGYKRT
ncbi:Endonuclease/exonuclease/phosphatase,Reverse transcriptase domain,Zinc finger, CCHC-type, partial [Cinara cedri]